MHGRPICLPPIINTGSQVLEDLRCARQETEQYERRFLEIAVEQEKLEAAAKMLAADKREWEEMLKGLEGRERELKEEKARSLAVRQRLVDERETAEKEVQVRHLHYSIATWMLHHNSLSLSLSLSLCVCVCVCAFACWRAMMCCVVFCGVVWCGVVWYGVVWCGVVWCGVVWCGVVWCGVVWCGVVWCGVVWCGVVWCGAVWCGVVWCGVVWCGVVWCGVVWCGVVWCGVVWCAEGAVNKWQRPG